MGKDLETGEFIWIKKGPYGHYVQLGESKTRKSIPKETIIADVTLELALQLLTLPRNVGIHPETGESITADYGRYGPYIKCGKQNASLRGPETPLDIDVEKSVELLASRNKKSAELRSLGEHPETGETLSVKDGRYGPYISDGKVNASLKNEHDPNTISLETAIELINAKRTAPKRARKRKKRKT